MTNRASNRANELFIVDNSDENWKVLQYLQQWCELSERIDIATGYFEIGSLLALKDEWKKVDHLRVLMGDEVSIRTQKAFQHALDTLLKRLDESIEAEKLTNNFLTGVPAIVDALKSSQINCRVYQKNKFHAKAYITHARQAVIGSFALVGSSNFTAPGLTKNIELNVRFGGTDVDVLQQWYEKHWNDAVDVQQAVLETIERHIRDYSPFEVYVHALKQFLHGDEISDYKWEHNHSRIFPKLGKYQQDAYGELLKKTMKYGGAFLCDGVGLGKTFVGMALIERLVNKDRQRVALFVPKAAREAVWESTLDQYLPGLSDGYGTLKIFNHTDLLRDGPIARQIKQVRDEADIIIIDEAHHFRNTGTKGDNPGERKSRYWAMYDLCENKRVIMLTATPINNRMNDLQHMIELFSRNVPNHFENIGIHSLPGHFRKLENELKQASGNPHDPDANQTNAVEAQNILAQDDLFKTLVVQRSRAYVRDSMITAGQGDVVFPHRNPPQVAEYELKKVYGRLLDMVDGAFHKKKPLFSLPNYNPWPYYNGNKEQLEKEEKFVEGRQSQIVSLIRTSFLKRLESSAKAFETSCWHLMQKLLAWVTVHSTEPSETKRLEHWKRLPRNQEILGFDQSDQLALSFDGQSPDEQDEDVISPEMLEQVEIVDRTKFNISNMIADAMIDLDQIIDFLHELRKFKPRNDSKLQALIKLLKTDPVLKDHKVLIFSEFMATARYLEKELNEAGITGVAEIDSNRASSDKRSHIIRRFAPYYNGSSSADLQARHEEEIRVLISTDVLSEGLNLQDATRLINYDLHWNPVRLMQRIGRVDRRMNPAVEERIKKDHPDRAAIRGQITYWNFLPPDELNRLLSLYKTVTHKTLRISSTLGIEGKQLLTPQDDYQALKVFDAAYEGQKSPHEFMDNKLQKILADHPKLEASLASLPGSVFSGKSHPQTSAAPAVFFCYALPGKSKDLPPSQGPNTLFNPASSPVHDNPWSLEAGTVRWYLLDLTKPDMPIIDHAPTIDAIVDTQPKTLRRCSTAAADLSKARKHVEKYIKNTYLKSLQAPLDAPKPQLIAWMELN